MLATETKTPSKDQVSPHPRAGLVSVDSTTLLADAIRLMAKTNTPNLVVLDGDRIMGILTLRDCLPFLCDRFSGRELDEAKVLDAMRTDFRVVDEATEIRQAIDDMVDLNLEALPLVRENRAIGVVTQADLFKLFHTGKTYAEGVNRALERGESFAASPLVQNVMLTLTEMGV